MPKAIVAVKHNFETAHRLSLTPGKCENIHGHSWWCTLSISGEVDSTGKVLEFGDVKKEFRSFLDANFDHRLLLYNKDSLLQQVELVASPLSKVYPGINTLTYDPTTENVAYNILQWAKETFDFGYEGFLQYQVELWETSVNMARVGGPL